MIDTGKKDSSLGEKDLQENATEKSGNRGEEEMKEVVQRVKLKDYSEKVEKEYRRTLAGRFQLSSLYIGMGGTTEGVDCDVVRWVKWYTNTVWTCGENEHG